MILDEHKVLADLYRRLPECVGKIMRSMGIEFWQESPQGYVVWLQWSRKYRIQFSLVVRIVVSHYRTVLAQQGSSLGVRMTTLVGPEAERLVAGEAPHWDDSPPVVGRDFRLRYDSEEQYADLMDKRRKANARLCRTTKTYRGSVGWCFDEDNKGSD